jgi:hypothetical protein
MPPNCPHAVFTPETEGEQSCLAIGGQFFTAPHLHSSLEALSLQEKYREISNEDLDDSIYNNLAGIIRACGSITTDVEKAQIVSSCSLFPSPLSEATLNSDLRTFGISAKKRSDFVEYLNNILAGNIGVNTPARNDFLKALEEFRQSIIINIEQGRRI